MDDVKCNYSHLRETCAACIPHATHKTVDCAHVAVTVKDDFDFGTALGMQLHLLENIFRYLDFPSLEAVKDISETWKELAEYELNKRNTTSWISCTQESNLVCSLYTSSNYFLNNMNFGIFAYVPSVVKLEKYVCVHGAVIERMTFAEYLSREVVPKNVKYCTISCTDVPLANIDKTNGTPLYQGIFIPTIPQIRVVPFYHNLRKKNKFVIPWDDDEEAKCLLTFAHKYPARSIESYLTALLQGRPWQSVAMGGGLIRSIKAFPMLKRIIRADDVFFIAFVQQNGVETNFDSYSMVVSGSDFQSKEAYNEKFEDTLVRLKQSMVLRESGIIFRFCCYAKEYKQDENEYIKEHFPKYPIFSIDVDGEIGWNSMGVGASNVEDEDFYIGSAAKRRKATVPRSLHGWSSILVLVTWGKTLKGCQMV